MRMVVWTIKNKGGHLFAMQTIAWLRRDAIASFVNDMNVIFQKDKHQWPWFRRKGYRAVKVEIIESGTKAGNAKDAS